LCMKKPLSPDEFWFFILYSMEIKSILSYLIFP
jgi:hypothetical protein